MKGTYLGEFEELLLLVILILADEAYGVSIKEEIYRRTERSISRGALHTSLTRLEKKGYIQSDFGEATPVRGGRRKKYYRLTQEGKKVLEGSSQSARKPMEGGPELQTWLTIISPYA